MITRASATSLALSVTMLVTLAAMTASAQGPVEVTDADGSEVVIDDASRVATFGGVVTEIAYALGAQDQVVAIDASSYFPPEALAEKPVLGYYRALAAEPVLASDPTLIIGSEEAGPPDVLAELRDAGITILLMPDQDTVEGARQLIGAIGQALGRDEAAEDVVATLDSDIAAAEELVGQATSTPRVLFILRPPGAPSLVAGADTAAGQMIALAGGENVYPDLEGYIPMTPESIAEVAPDVILTTEDSLEQFGGLEALLDEPGVGQTPAAADDRVVAMEDLYLLGFGPRTGQAIADLARLLHPELAP